MGSPDAVADALTLEEGITVNWTRVQQVAILVCFISCGLMIAASFMPWLSSDGGRTLSGWDIYESQRGSGGNVFIVPQFFTDSDGSTTPFVTGLVTLLSGVWLAVGTAVFFALYGLGHPREGAGLRDRRRWVRLIHVFVVVIPAAVGGAENMFFYFSGGGRDSGASLEYGLILLWGATIVGGYASIATLPGSRRRSAAASKTGTAAPSGS